jgi:hypothetical protein
MFGRRYAARGAPGKNCHRDAIGISTVAATCRVKSAGAPISILTITHRRQYSQWRITRISKTLAGRQKKELEPSIYPVSLLLHIHHKKP